MKEINIVIKIIKDKQNVVIDADIVRKHLIYDHALHVLGHKRIASEIKNYSCENIKEDVFLAIKHVINDAIEYLFKEGGEI